MSADSDSAAASKLNLTPEEKRVYGDLFKQADPDNLRVVTGDAALSFFDKTRLDSRILGEIWQIADTENRGLLTPAGFGIVLRLIGHAQAGREPRPDLAFQPGPLPRFDGITLATSTNTPPPSATALQAQGTGGAARVPPLMPDKVAQYTALFERQPLQGNMLSGEQARQIFDKSGLSNEALGRIWALADTEQRGALVLAEFVLAMHLLTSMKTGALRVLPNVLPAGLYEAATQRSAALQSPTSTGISAIPRQLSGSAQPRTGSPLGRPHLAPQTTGSPAGDWAVSAADKDRFDQLYATLDKGNKGFITGDQAVPFFSQSGLSEDALAQIWDLADFDSQGTLTQEGFAVAMYLIRQMRSGRSSTLPATLPPNLVPPSMRNQARPPAVASAFNPPPMTQPPPPQPKSALDDLFGLDSSSPSPAPQQTTMSTGGSAANDPFGGGTSALPPTSPIKPTATGTTFKPFMPSSSFGRGLKKQPSADAMGSAFKQAPAAQSEDLLEDNDPEASKKITGETTELANLSNQIGSLSKQMQDVQTKRSATQNELNQTNSQKQNFEHRLAQLRTLYEKEAENTRALDEQLRKSRAETQKLQGECMTLEGTLRDQQAQYQQVSAALQADQQENASFRERIRVVNNEIAQLKPQFEKLKSEARQQKGLAAINKKQLATIEGERDKIKEETETLAKGGDDSSRQLDTASPAPGPAQVTSPALSTASGNNPFFKRTASTDVMGSFTSPTTRGVQDQSFDEVFGPTLPHGSTGSPSPTTSKQQHTGNSLAGASSGNAAPNTPFSRQGTQEQPPPPPESRQISSSFLPFPNHPESLSSSRQVSPPASRVEGSVASSSNPFPTGNDGVDAPAAPMTDDEKSPTPSATPVPGSAHGLPAGETSAKSPQATAGEIGVGAAPTTFGNGDQAKAKADFDDAFAAFAATGKSPGPGAPDGSKAFGAFDTEFPPIEELDSDSDSDSERGGFDDDFTAASPPNKAGEKRPEVEAGEAASGAADAAPDVPAKEKLSSTEPARQGAEQPSSPATITDSSKAGPQATTNAHHMFASPAPGPSQSTAKGAFDDLDDDFEGLEDAKEGSADDDFANISRDDFNPVFDSSPPASQTKSESTAFGNESSFDFVHSNPAGGAAAASGSGQPKAPESHDWDAIFAGLDSPSAMSPGINDPSSGNDGKKDLSPQPPGRDPAEPAEHDDPMVQNLTSMGYSRTAAVTALEKYDYNLERAANHLASHS